MAIFLVVPKSRAGADQKIDINFQWPKVNWKEPEYTFTYWRNNAILASRSVEHNPACAASKKSAIAQHAVNTLYDIHQNSAEIL